MRVVCQPAETRFRIYHYGDNELGILLKVATNSEYNLLLIFRSFFIENYVCVCREQVGGTGFGAMCHVPQIMVLKESKRNGTSFEWFIHL